jgi:kynureninase
VIDDLAEARQRDANDPCGQFRARFSLPEDVVYLDGNSLGALPVATKAVLDDAVARQWGRDLVTSWNRNGWMDVPQRIGDRIASLIGAKPGEVIVTDSVSINIFKLLTALIRLRPGRRTILSEAGNFPTDAYVASGVADMLGLNLRLAERDGVLAALDDDCVALLLTHVHYRTGARFDMAAVNAAAVERGIPVIWDLSHSVGAIPLNLHEMGSEYAVGCGYKYLNGGPGAPGFVYVAGSKQAVLRPALQGWMGHHAPFDFTDEFFPGQGMQRFRTGTPPILSMLALESGIAAFDGVDMAALWRKSVELFTYFATLMTKNCPEFRLVTPADPMQRGSHISFAHRDGWPINNALIARGVIGDYRHPDILRFGLSPLYTGFADVWRAVDALADIMRSGEWRRPEFSVQSAVT